MNLQRYDDHVFTVHQADLENPDFEEFDQARGQFQVDLEISSAEELKTFYCDYDSEKERRYSEDESGEESNNDNIFESEREIIQPSGYASSANSSSTSSSENTSKGSITKQKKKLRIKKKPLHSVPLNKYNTDKQETFQLQEEKYNDFNQELQRVSSENITLEKKNKLNERAISDVKTNIKALQDSSRKNAEENRKTISLLENMISEKENSLDKDDSEKKEEQELITRIQDLIRVSVIFRRFRRSEIFLSMEF